MGVTTKMSCICAHGLDFLGGGAGGGGVLT